MEAKTFPHYRRKKERKGGRTGESRKNSFAFRSNPNLDIVVLLHFTARESGGGGTEEKKGGEKIYFRLIPFPVGSRFRL